MMLEGKRAVLFDLDGTLVDSMGMWKAIDIDFLDRFGHTCPDDLQRMIEGMSFSEGAAFFKERFGLPITVEEIREIWIGMSIEKYRTSVPFKPGAEAFLKELRARGIRIGIATSNERGIVDTVLRALKAEGYFDAITTGCEVAAGKPSPDIYLEAAKRVGADPSECMVFEDVPARLPAGTSSNTRQRAGCTASLLAASR